MNLFSDKWAVRLILVFCFFTAGCVPLSATLGLLHIIESNKLSKRVESLEAYAKDLKRQFDAEVIEES